MEPIDNKLSANSLRKIALTSSFQPAILATNPLEHGLASYQQELAHNPVSLTIILANGFQTLAGQLHIIIDGYFPWKQWGRLAQTCKALNDEFSLRMKSKLSRDSQLELKKNPNDRAVLINQFQHPCNRVVGHLLINQKDINYIQQELGINCGPNMLIAIKKGQLTLDGARQRLQEPAQDLRTSFHYLEDKYFLVLQKYCVDDLFLVETLTVLSSDAVIRLAKLLITSEMQSYLDHIALEIDQPVQIQNPVIFFSAIQKFEIQGLLDADVFGTAQLLTVTESGIRALCNTKLRVQLLQGLITMDQIETYAQEAGLRADAF